MYKTKQLSFSSKAAIKKNAFQQNLLQSSLIAAVNDRFQSNDALDPSHAEDEATQSDANSQDIQLLNDEITCEIIILSYAKYKTYFEALDLIQPHEIILYDVELEIIRNIEVYQSYGSHVVNVHFMMYEDSIEEYRYLNTIQNEKRSFEQLNKMTTNLVIRYSVTCLMTFMTI